MSSERHMPSTIARPWMPQFQHPVDESPSVVFSDLGRAWNETITRLMEAGFTFRDAALWEIAREPGCGNDALAVHATLYRAAGFTAAEAVEWFCSGINPIEAVAYANRGWVPWQALSLRRLLHAEEGTSGPVSRNGSYSEPHDAETWWLWTMIPPARVLRYVAAGFTDHEATILESRHLRGDLTVDPAVDMLAALRTTATPRP